MHAFNRGHSRFQSAGTCHSLIGTTQQLGSEALVIKEVLSDAAITYHLDTQLFGFAAALTEICGHNDCTAHVAQLLSLQLQLQDTLTC